MDSREFIGKTVNVVIDRPIHSLHPVYSFEYMLNYGYIPNTVSGDGEPLDAYIIGVDNPLKEYTGKVVAVIKRLEEDDDKLIVTDGKDYTDEEILKLVNFQEKWKKHVILR